MVIISAAIITFLTSFLNPIGLTSGADVEGTERFGKVVEDPRALNDERTFMGVWQHCP